MKTDVVSIITPMYNASETIAQTIESVLQQTYENWELLIVNDCSTDQSIDIVSEYAKRDHRIRLLSQEINQGIAAARNRGIREATGRYIAFLDSDDLWTPNKLQRQLQVLQERDCAFVYSSYGIVNEKGEKLPQTRRASKVLDYRKLLYGNPIGCLTVLLDRTVVGDPMMPEIPHEDYGAWLDVLKRGYKAYPMDEVLAYYRVNQNSRSGNKKKAAAWTWNIYRNYLQLSLPKSLACFVGYVFFAIKKRLP